ncbi:MAG: hypothetical protein HYX41_04740 [Bdellovibrio sp.]|nr:hypothetical protein [Bdellovibrio sp.]
MADKAVNIIIKRVKGGAHGAGHGGAWKVAYADFVTAMMCFFLVMWLMGSDDETKASISAYFNNPNPTSAWRPELKDNENIPLGNRTGAGDSILKGAETSEQLAKDPPHVVNQDQNGKVEADGILTEEAISAADGISFSILEDDIFADSKSDVIVPEKALRLLSIVGKVSGIFKGHLKIRGILDKVRDDNYELRVSRIVAIQHFIIDHHWISEDTVHTAFRKAAADRDGESGQSRKVELVFSR